MKKKKRSKSRIISPNSSPAQVYRNNGWKGWADYLGVQPAEHIDLERPSTIYTALLPLNEVGTAGYVLLTGQIDHPGLNDIGDILRIFWPMVSCHPDLWWEKKLFKKAIARYPSASGYPDRTNAHNKKEMKKSEKRFQQALFNIATNT